jgi:hypothetical protein
MKTKLPNSTREKSNLFCNWIVPMGSITTKRMMIVLIRSAEKVSGTKNRFSNGTHYLTM